MKYRDVRNVVRTPLPLLKLFYNFHPNPGLYEFSVTAVSEEVERYSWGIFQSLCGLIYTDDVLPNGTTTVAMILGERDIQYVFLRGGRNQDCFVVCIART